jgi:hypothetical protein
MGGDDSINGGGGFNILEYFDSTDAVKVDLRIQNGGSQFISASQGTDTFVNISDVYGSFFDDTLIGSGTDNILFGRDGDDQLVVSNTAFFAADGAEGIDRLVVNGSSVNITHQDVLDKLFGIEQIDLRGSSGINGVALVAQDILDTSDTDVMRIMGDTGDIVNAGGGFVFNSQQMIDGQLHNVFTANVFGSTVTLQVEADVTVFT